VERVRKHSNVPLVELRNGAEEILLVLAAGVELAAALRSELYTGPSNENEIN